MASDPPTVPAVPDSPPDDASTWAEDARDLLAFCGADWSVTRADDDPLTLIAERRIGTELHILAGTPRVILAKIRDLPPAPSRPADLIVPDNGRYHSGRQS